MYILIYNDLSQQHLRCMYLIVKETHNIRSVSFADDALKGTPHKTAASPVTAPSTVLHQISLDDAWKQTPSSLDDAWRSECLPLSLKC